MVFVTWILFVIALAVWMYYIFLYNINKDEFLKQKTIIEFSAIFITILFTIFTFNQAESSIQSSTREFDSLVVKFEEIIGDVKESKNVLSNVRESLSRLPTQVDSFSHSINKLNFVVNSQQGEIEKSLKGFNKGIINLSDAIDTVVETLNKSPKIDVDLETVLKDTLLYLKQIVLSNKGEATAYIKTIGIVFHRTIIDTLTWENSRITSETKDRIRYQKDFDKQSLIYGVEKYLNDTIKATIRAQSSLPIKIIVFIYYTSNFGVDGIFNKEFLFTL